MRTYVYDADGRMMGEYGASAADVKAETIWLSPEVAGDAQLFGGDDGVGGYAPLAVATGTAGTLYWVHGNHLGVPIVTTDSAGNLAAPTGYTRVGFPGQTQTLADLYYNRYRDYDPTTGRYIQADPIGLDGGDNPYAYAGNNPIANIDPWGLTAICPAHPPAANDKKWTPYVGNPKWFHCGYPSVLENRHPTPDNPIAECVYDENRNLVTKKSTYCGCIGTPDQYSARTDPIQHTLIDSGGIVRAGGPAFIESIRHMWNTAPQTPIIPYIRSNQ